MPNHDYDYDQFLEAEVKIGNDREYLMAKLSVLLAVLSLLINSFHLFILTRNDIRKLSVFFIMTSICICDIVSALAAIALFSYTISVYKRTDYCLYYSSQMETEFLRVVNAIGASSFTTSVWLVVLMAGYRALSNLFPLGSLNRKLADIRTAFFSILIVILLNVAWKIYPFVEVYKIYKRVETDVSVALFLSSISFLFSCYLIKDTLLINPDQYQLTVFKEDIPLSETVEKANNILLAIQIVLYVFFTVVLVASLKTSKSTSSSKNTTYLVIAMTVVFLIQESIAPVLNLIIWMLPKKGVADALSNGYRTLSYAIKIVHSGSQFFICYFISTLYRDVVRKVRGRKNRDVVQVILGRSKTSN